MTPRQYMRTVWAAVDTYDGWSPDLEDRADTLYSWWWWGYEAAMRISGVHDT